MATGKRELVDTGRGTQYVHRDAKGRFTTARTEGGRSSAADPRPSATTPAGRGDRGDQVDRVDGRTTR